RSPYTFLTPSIRTKCVSTFVTSSKIFFEESPHLVPAIHCLLLSVSRPVVIEETMPGFRIYEKLVGLSILLQFLFMLGNLLGSWGLILLAKESQERTGQILRIIYWCNGILRCQFLLGHDNSSAPAIYCRVEALRSASNKEHLPSSRTGAKYSRLAVALRKRFQVTQTPFHIAHDVIVGHPACSPYLRGNILWHTVAELLVDVGADCQVAMVGELSSGFPVPLVPSWCMVDQNNSREGSWAQRPREICVDHGAIMSRDHYGFCYHSLVHIRPILLHARYSP